MKDSNWLPRFKKDDSPCLFEMSTIIPARFKCPRCKECGQFQSFKNIHNCPVSNKRWSFSLALDTALSRVKVNLDEQITKQMSQMREVRDGEPGIVYCDEQMLRSAGNQNTVGNQTNPCNEQRLMGLPKSDDTSER